MVQIPGQAETWNPRNATLRRASARAAAEQSRRRVPPPPRALMNLNRPIQKQRWRLDLNPTLSELSDPDPSAQIQSYRFGLAIFLKSPWTFRELTRSPLQFKNNYSSAQKLTRTPCLFSE